MTSCPKLVDSPTLTIHSANACPFGKLVTIGSVMSLVKPCAPDACFATVGHGAGPLNTQALCQCDPNTRPPASAKSFTACRMVVGAAPAPLLSFPSHDISMTS